MKRTALITIASLLAVIASIFTFSYFQKGSNEPQNTINTTIEPKDTAQVPETTPEEPKILESDLDTSTWKTYRNDEFGFEVKYPERVFMLNVDQDSSGVMYVQLYNRAVSGVVYEEPVLQINLNDWISAKYSALRKVAICIDIVAANKPGELCEENATKMEIQERWRNFSDRGIYTKNMGFVIFKPDYSNEDAFGVNHMYIKYDDVKSLQNQILYKVYQSIKFTK